MRLKRFVASDSAKAMRKIKEALGDDAVILSSHTVKEGVEIVAAVDYDETAVNNKLALTVDDPISVTGLTPVPNDKPIKSHRITNEKPLTDLEVVRQEVAHLRELIESQLSGFAWQSLSHYAPMQMMLLKRLTKLGFDINTSEKLAQSIPEQANSQKAWLALLSSILKQIRRSENLIESEGYYAFVGPTGVGKTTTIAKLAARFCLKYDASELGLVTLDGYRIAAVEQLVTYGKILGVNVSVAQNQETLITALNKLSHKKLVLIDTAGVSHKDQRVAELFAMFQACHVAVQPVLVLSAISQYHVLQKICQQYQPFDVDNCIITKVDEAEEIGAVISMLLNEKVAVSYVTNGQRVPEDLHWASNQTLLRSLIDSQEDFNKELNINELVTSLSGSDVYA